MALDLFSAGRPPEWRHRLIWGDKPSALRFSPVGAGRGGGSGAAGGVCLCEGGSRAYLSLCLPVHNRRQIGRKQ